MFSSSALNTLFLHVYSFIIGAFYSIRALGVYSQADKWSKMGTASLSQVLTSSFVPLLSRVQDSPVDFKRYVTKINRFTAFILFPAMLGLAAVGEPLFHTLFGNKWDSAIILFQILCIRGVFVVLVSLYGNYLLSAGYGKKLFFVEVVKDVAIVMAVLATVFFRSLEALVWGQLVASVLTYAIIVRLTGRSIGYGVEGMMRDLLPFSVAGVVMGFISVCLSRIDAIPVVSLFLSVIGGAVVYIGIMIVGRFPELKEAAAYLFGRFKKK